MVSVGICHYIRNGGKTNGLIRVTDWNGLLGYKLKPNLNGEAYFLYPDSSKIYPIHSDKSGNRISKFEDNCDKQSLFLYFGCSFTFGEFCDADSTYPSLVSKQFDARCVNAAMGGYGYSQLLLRAKELIPVYKPQFVFVQYTDWLIERSQSIHNITVQPLQISNPFFYRDNQRNEMQIAPPLYDNKDVVELVRNISDHREGFLNQLGLIFKMELLLMKKDLTNIKIYLLQKIKILPNPSKDRGAILEYALHEFQKLCSENNCKLIIVGMGPQTMDISPAFNYINTEKALESYAEAVQGSYDTLYHHWAGSPPRNFDDHPNHFAGLQIAEELIKRISTGLIINH